MSLLQAMPLEEQSTEYAVRILWSADGLPEYRRMGSRADALAFRTPHAPWSLTPVRRHVGAWEEDSERPTGEEFHYAAAEADRG